MALFVHGNNVLIDNCTFQFNNANGLSLGNECSNLTVRNCRFLHNGWKGLGASRPNNMLLVDTESSFNCWRGHWGGVHGWDSAAAKIMGPGGPQGVRVERYTAIGNYSHGLWFDHAEVERAPIYVADSIFAGNTHQSQLYIEKQPGPIVIKRNVIWGSTPRGSLLAVAKDVTLEDNLLYLGNPSGFLIKLERRTNGVTNASTNWLVRRNVMFVDGTRARLYARAGATTEEHRAFVESLRADRNLYWNAQRTRAFENADAQYVTFADWQTQTGQDANSAFTAFEFVDAAKGDWRLRDPKLRHVFSKWPMPTPEWRAFVRERQQSAETQR